MYGHRGNSLGLATGGGADDSGADDVEAVSAAARGDDSSAVPRAGDSAGDASTSADDGCGEVAAV